MTTPPLPYSGGCQCGAIRYEIREAPLTLYACHCRDCQRQAGGGFGMSMPVPRSGLVLLQGTPKDWRRAAASGRELVCQFCPDCGTRLFHNPSRNPKVVNVKPGTLDDTSWLRPVGHLWISRAQPWLVFRPDELTYDTQPTEFSALFDRWRESKENPS